MDGSIYCEVSADPRLSAHVAGHWALRVSGSGAHAVLPDGCIDLLFDAGQARLVVVGTMTRALWVQHCGPSAFAGVRFKPAGAVPLVREAADVLTDEIVDAEALFGRDACRLCDELVATRDNRDRVGLLEDFVLRRVGDAAPPDPRICWAAEQLRADPSLRVERLAAELGWSRQALRRRFVQATGLTPKVFARVMRLQALVAAMPAQPSLADAAQVVGYADQPHMVREFRALVGVSPGAYSR